MLLCQKQEVFLAIVLTTLSNLKPATCYLCGNDGDCGTNEKCTWVCGGFLGCWNDCRCAPGYGRNGSNICVPLSEFPTMPPPPPPPPKQCATFGCGPPKEYSAVSANEYCRHFCSEEFNLTSAGWQGRGSGEYCKTAEGETNSTALSDKLCRCNMSCEDKEAMESPRHIVSGEPCYCDEPNQVCGWSCSENNTSDCQFSGCICAEGYKLPTYSLFECIPANETDEPMPCTIQGCSLIPANDENPESVKVACTHFCKEFGNLTWDDDLPIYRHCRSHSNVYGKSWIGDWPSNGTRRGMCSCLVNCDEMVNATDEYPGPDW